MGTLYLVATPIGNLEDVTLRALRVLREVHLIAAEDTRTTRKLLAAHGIRTRLTSYHDLTGPGKTRRLVEMLAEGDLALVSEAGMPGLCDPGYPLIRQALEAGFGVVPVPGPSAAVAALVASGLPAHAFHFLGFLPRKKGDRRRILESVSGDPHTLVMFEAPHRLLASLEEALLVLGDRPMAVARELTKLHEEFIRGTISQVAEHFRSAQPRGEFTLVVGGKGSGAQVAA